MYDINLYRDKTFCQVTGNLELASQWVFQQYSIWFCLAIIYKLKSSLYSKYHPGNLYHYATFVSLATY